MTYISNPTAPAKNIRVRFAPSPTGVLHIGAFERPCTTTRWRSNKAGTFILRIEDTDQGRYVEGAVYIAEALQWCGLTPDEGPGFGGGARPLSPVGAQRHLPAVCPGNDRKRNGLLCVRHARSAGCAAPV